jgi:hypothetical protein
MREESSENRYSLDGGGYNLALKGMKHNNGDVQSFSFPNEEWQMQFQFLN